MQIKNKYVQSVIIYFLLIVYLYSINKWKNLASNQSIPSIKQFKQIIIRKLQGLLKKKVNLIVNAAKSEKKI